MTGCDLLDFGIQARQNGKRLPCERLMAENAKLRKACAELAEFLTEAEWLQWPELRAEMRELGMEV